MPLHFRNERRLLADERGQNARGLLCRQDAGAHLNLLNLIDEY